MIETLTGPIPELFFSFLQFVSHTVNAEDSPFAGVPNQSFLETRDKTKGIVLMRRLYENVSIEDRNSVSH